MHQYLRQTQTTQEPTFTIPPISSLPTIFPTIFNPTPNPTNTPTFIPSIKPTLNPIIRPTPSMSPSMQPTTEDIVDVGDGGGSYEYLWTLSLLVVPGVIIAFLTKPDLCKQWFDCIFCRNSSNNDDDKESDSDSD